MVGVASNRVSLAVSLYRPLVTADAVDGEWFAVISDGKTHIDVVRWPLQQCRLEVDISAIIHIELYLAGDEAQFLRGEGQRFAEVHMPVSKVRQSYRGSLFRGWFGLQRGVHHEQVTADDADVLYEASLVLAQNLLTPKLCCTVAEEGFAPGPVSEDEPLHQSLVQHSNMIIRMHQQLQALWSQGKLALTTQPNGELVAELVEEPPPGGLQKQQEEVPCGGAETQQLHEALEAERQRAAAAEQQLEALQQRVQEGLCADFEALSVENQQLRIDLESMRVACGQESEQCASADAEVRQLQGEVAMLRERMAADRSELQEVAAEAQRRVERERSELQDAAYGEIDELRSTLRARTSEFREQVQSLRGELEASEASLRSCDDSSRKVESRLRSEIHDLEEANDQMSRETKAQFDEMAQLQERMTAEIIDLRKEPVGSGRADLASAHEVNARLRTELEAKQSALHELQAQAQGYRECERRVAQLEAQLRSSGPTAARRLSPSSRSQPRLLTAQQGAGRAAGVQALDLAQAREKVAEVSQELLHLGVRKGPLRESQPSAANVPGALPAKTSPLLRAAAAAAAATAGGNARSPSSRR